MAHPKTDHPWPAWLVLLLAPIRPVAACRRSDRLPIWTAWLLYNLCGLGLLILFAAAEAVFSVDPWDVDGAMARFPGRLEQAFSAPFESRESTTVSAFVLLAFQAAAIPLAWVLMAWAAQPGRATEAFLRTLRRLWLLAPHALLVLAMYLLVATVQSWAYYASGRELWWADEISASTVFMGFATWSVGVTLLATLPTGWRAHCRWPPQCEACGYNLAALSSSATCPECGRPVAASIDEEGRPGSPWSCWGPALFPAAWFATLAHATFRPTSYGFLLRTLDPSPQDRWMLAPTFVAAFVINALGFQFVTAAQFVFWEGGLAEFLVFWGEIGRVALIFGIACGLGTVGLALAAATLVGSVRSRLTGTNLLPAAMLGSAALSGLLLVWTAGIWVSAIVAMLLVAVQPLSSFVYNRLQIDLESLLALTLVCLHLLLLLVYPYLLGHIVTGARYANR